MRFLSLRDWSWSARELEVGGVDSTAKMWAGRDRLWTNKAKSFLTALVTLGEVAELALFFFEKRYKKGGREWRKKLRGSKLLCFDFLCLLMNGCYNSSIILFNTTPSFPHATLNRTLVIIQRKHHHNQRDKKNIWVSSMRTHPKEVVVHLPRLIRTVQSAPKAYRFMPDQQSI